MCVLELFDKPKIINKITKYLDKTFPKISF